MKQSNIDAAEQYIRSELAAGPRLYRDLISASTISKRTLQRAAQNLGITRSRSSVNGPWVWHLPERLPPPVVEQEHLFRPPAEPPQQAPTPTTATVPMALDDLLAMALAS